MSEATELQRNVRWGIMGAANIALKNARAISLSPNSEIVAIASRSLAKASDFLDRCPMSDANKARVQLHGSYEALLEDKNVDVVYLPLPTSMHIIWAVKAAYAGKHILLEKPCAVSNAELLTIIEACRRNSVVFMDGVMFMHHERMTKIRQCLSDPLFGMVKRVSSSFSFNSGDSFIKDNIRTNAALDSLGALGDLGWYQIRMGIIAMNNGREFESSDDSEGSLQINCVPISCRATCSQRSPGDVPMDCEGVVTFYNPKSKFGNSTLHFDCSFVLPFRQHFEVLSLGRSSSCGDKIMRCDDFVIPRKPSEASFDLETLHPSGSLADHDTRQLTCLETHRVQCLHDQEVNMVTKLSEIVKGIGIEGIYAGNSAAAIKQMRYFELISLLTQAVVDACAASVGGDGETVLVDTSFLAEGN